MRILHFSKTFALGVAFVLVCYLITTFMIRPKKVFPEDLLLSWGYTTTSIDKEKHQIRSLKNYGSTGKAVYARFDLSVVRLGSAAEAQSAIDKIEIARDSSPGIDKDHRQFLRRDEMFYTITPTSNYTRLEHQPRLIALIQSHLDGEESQATDIHIEKQPMANKRM